MGGSTQLFRLGFVRFWLDFFQLAGEDDGVESREGFASDSHGGLECGRFFASFGGGCKQSLLSIAKTREFLLFIYLFIYSFIQCVGFFNDGHLCFSIFGVFSIGHIISIPCVEIKYLGVW